ncbi:MAG: PLDc N-terminal domain-containing protein, partial [Treponema sp.]|nr:PLDc N-terminal domain-containing protein [Treponema sp.]
MKKKWVRVVFRRRVFVIFTLLFQICFLLFLIASSSMSFHYISWTLNVLSIIVSVHVLNKKEKAAYKLTWIFLIMTFPIFGGIMYILFYFQSNPRKLRRLIERTIRQSQPFFSLSGDSLPALAAVHPECFPQAYYLQSYAGFPVYTHTRTEYFAAGMDFFRRVLEEMEKAERYIFMEFFILRQGKMLDPMLSIMEKKAREGLDVRIIYDDLGCFMSLPPNFTQHLKQRGIQ